jgi:hypothetical protein
MRRRVVPILALSLAALHGAPAAADDACNKRPALRGAASATA